MTGKNMPRAIQFAPALPCGVRVGVSLCAQPATAGMVFHGDREAGAFVLQPMCQECAQAMAKIYQTDGAESGT